MSAPTLGVEEEFLLVDARTGLPCPSGEDVVARAEQQGGDGVEHELRTSMAETGSAVCEDLEAVAAEVARKRSALLAAAEAVGARVLAAGSHPTADPEDDGFTPVQRYQRMAEHFGSTASAALVCGCHVHVAVPDRETGVAVLDRLRPWTPLLLAVTASSPFWRGADTGYASWRQQVWKRFPTAGPTSAFGSLEAYERLLRQLIATGGALDDAMVYFDARLSARYPTVEVRVADVCRDPDDVLLYAALARALVMTALDAVDAPAPDVPVELLRAATWSASRYGTQGRLVDPLALEARPAADVLQVLRRHVADALEQTGDAGVVDEGLARVLRRGTGADVQRGAFARGGAAAVLDAVALTPAP